MADTAADLRKVVKILRDQGHRVELVPGWESRGKGRMTTRGRIEHHTAGARTGNAPSLRVVTFGRAGLRNSLSRWYVARNGTIYLVALGVSWHAGVGSKGTNSTLSGTEAEHTGTAAEKWSDESLAAQAAITRAEARVFGLAPWQVHEHREHAPRRKVDRYGIDGDAWRVRIATAREPEEDILASIADLRKVVDQALDRSLRPRDRTMATIEQRANEAVRLSEAAAQHAVAQMRAGLDLPPNENADGGHVAAIRAGDRDLNEVYRRLVADSQGQWPPED